MSFSYIKTVFPKFESSKVYNDQLYSNINSPTAVPPTPTAVPPTPTAVPVSFLSPHSQQLQGFDLQNQTIIKGTVETNVEKFAPVSKDNYLTSIPNLKYYNVPIPPQNVVQLPRASPQLLLDLNQQQEIEKFENGGTKCNNIVKHISECSYCRELLMKQFNVESDKIRNEEIMELISYIMFGIFVILLLDRRV